MNDKDSNPKRESSGSGSMCGYRVEARYNYSTPKTIGDMILDERWRTIDVGSAPPGFGVPLGCSYDEPFLKKAGMMGYATAQAIRWWLHAEADREMLGGLCLETRIVKYRISYSFEVDRLSEHCHIHGDDRSNMMPDWGGKKAKPLPETPPAEEAEAAE